MLLATVRVNRLNEMGPQSRTRLEVLGWGEHLGLVVGSTHYVCALGFWGGVSWFYLVGKEAMPQLYPAECFELDMDEIPEGWLVRAGQGDRSSYWVGPASFMTPTFEDFYEKLVDDNPECLRIYSSFKSRNGLF
jgi:hypothetical protein